MFSHHGFPEPVVLAYPSADGFFISVCETPITYSKNGSCCSHERRVKPSYFRHYPTATRPLTSTFTDAKSGTTINEITGLEITEIGSGSTCQDQCFKLFRMLLIAWTIIGLIFLLLVTGLGLYYWSGIEEADIKSSIWLSTLLDYGPVVGFFVSLVLLLVPALGFFGTYKENTWLLITFGVLMIANSAIKALSPPRNPLLGFSATILVLLIPFALHISMNKRMSRAI